MKILFVHQNMPGQYRELVRWLAAQGGHELVFLSQRGDVKIPGVHTLVYKAFHTPAKDGFGLAKDWEAAAGAGFGAVQAAQKFEQEHGFRPDIILGHTGWGELSFFKDLWPDVPIIGFFEYYYSMDGGMVGFDPEQPPGPHAPYFNRARNVVPCLNREVVDLGHVPTYWQRDRFPASFHDKMYVCHDGIRADRLHANPDAQITLGRLEQPISRGDEIVTYVARNMERARGFHIMMRALPAIQAARPNARILMIGGNEASYGRESDHPGGLRGEMEAEVGQHVDWSRVHFLGRVPYADLCRIIQLSRCHIYLTMPFVLSWSLLEAMAMEATIVAADVAPVREAIRHNETGLLVDFFDPEALAAQVAEVLAQPDDFAALGARARARVMQDYDFLTRCLPEHLSQINQLVTTTPPIRLP